jgi:glycerol dehydrogenase
MPDYQPNGYSPLDIYAAPTAGGWPPRVFGAPQRYVQGNGVIDNAGRYLAPLGIRHAAVLLSRRSRGAEGRRLLDSLAAAGIEYTPAIFGGECSAEEIGGHAEALRGLSRPLDALIAIGGGKPVDAGKCIAHRLGVPVVIVPTLASNDAPCSAVSVLYTPQGVSVGVEFFPLNPLLVLVDTGIVAAAAERYLVAGMGDAMATWYEARVCAHSAHGITAMGGRPTLSAEMLGRLCADTLYENGPAAVEAVARNAVDEALERVVEANTLLSGIGFESGGLAAAHALAQGYTVVPHVHANYLHGEMVAMGLLTQLVLESNLEEATRVAEFFVQIGLPVHLGQLGLGPDDRAELSAVVADSLAFPFLANLPFEVNGDMLHRAVLEAHQLGVAVTARRGEAGYLALRA